MDPLESELCRLRVGKSHAATRSVTTPAVGQAGTYLVVVAIVLAVLIPLFWMVSASLKTQNEVYDFA